MKAVLQFTAALALLSATPLFAQENTTSENVTVSAPYVVTQTTSGMSKDRATTVTVSRTVGIGDLDLATMEGQVALRNRLQQVAGDVCHEMDRRFPPSVHVPATDTHNCVRDAVNLALDHVRSAKAG